MTEHILNSTEETKKIAYDFASKIISNSEKATIVGLYGELGAGKTTFMKYLAEYFGIQETIQSPTFVIEKIYELKGKPFEHLIHIDAYRIEKPEEMIHLGWEEIIHDPKNLICVEWPEKIEGILPAHIVIRFEHAEGDKNTGENTRKISFA